MSTSKNYEAWIMLSLEKEIWAQGYRLIAGIDEAGRGPLAGPVVASAVIFDKGVMIPGVNDSKKLSPKRREELFQKIENQALAIGIGLAAKGEIDQTNILIATHWAMQRALSDLRVEPDFLLIDGRITIGHPAPQRSVIKGDQISHSIAAASIIAKVTRDWIMRQFDRRYPRYGFAAHKGYPTRRHREAIKKYGFCPIHRRSFHVK